MNAVVWIKIKYYFNVYKFPMITYLIHYFDINGVLYTFKSNYCRRTQCVQIDGSISNIPTTVCGVPIGSTLGPM